MTSRSKIMGCLAIALVMTSLALLKANKNNDEENTHRNGGVLITTSTTRAFSFRVGRLHEIKSKIHEERGRLDRVASRGGEFDRTAERAEKVRKPIADRLQRTNGKTVLSPEEEDLLDKANSDEAKAYQTYHDEMKKISN